jgi:hypothetical protein
MFCNTSVCAVVKGFNPTNIIKNEKAYIKILNRTWFKNKDAKTCVGITATKETSRHFPMVGQTGSVFICF